ncbi:translation initiation factor IF-2 N-terminal domain-containing protein [Sulfurimonas sp.]|jgi:hypothetical protein|uniref:translation initiation factor IF-2 N-terminal domain-containing protein n=1 Tax=Sulfurimonas sp. TaxID=2022749 RepID=UPI0025E147CB|nr:translation initiation factor IF-2 N-terminal domain-containing protein [Sulfurimonas sp.]MBT5935184.1 hypothetical protein [Sulfurimonas sp.]
MDNIKIQEIADELGLQSKELVEKVQHLYENVKSSSSSVTEQEAQEIFEILLSGTSDKTKKPKNSLHDNINLFFSHKKIDIKMLEQLTKIYTKDDTEDFLIASFNFSEHSIVKILVSGLINLDIKEYISKNTNTKELVKLMKNMHKVLDDVEFEDSGDKDPLQKLKYYIESNEPEIVYLEGVTFSEYIKHQKAFEFIRKHSQSGVNFVIGFVQISEVQEQVLYDYFSTKVA